jgi:hypothetical protein
MSLIGRVINRSPSVTLNLVRQVVASSSKITKTLAPALQ